MTRHATDREFPGLPGSGARRRRDRCRQVLVLAFSAWFAAAGTVATVARAQAEGADFRAPVIEHDPEPGGVSGRIEAFVANVVDNDRLDSVKLFHRFAGETDFAEQSMRPMAASSFYRAMVDTAGEETTAIEYYIRAEDVSGNIALSGFAFEPLVRTLTPVEVAQAPAELLAESGIESDAEPVLETESGGKLNWLYVGLGVLVLGGVVAGLSDPDDDNDDDGAGSCSPDCQVTLTIAVP